ncbi:hypothetical protein B5X24_HaOG210992 [Helicoverpa armigera]|nr:hypothetical protein B5X24_HaOG210992 [Helicoverpa armigera]
MCLELPVLTRCCMCFPLRYGLLVWSYIRLSIGLLFLTSLTTDFLEQLNAEPEPHDGIDLNFGLVVTVMVLTSTDVVLNALFIVGGHMKNLRLLRPYYIYNIILLILMILLYILTFAYCLTYTPSADLEDAEVLLAALYFTVYIGHIVIQFYMILLIRSEIIKLRNNSELGFVNNVAQLEMQYETDGVNTTDNGGNKNI